jgi:hypothetical protein
LHYVIAGNVQISTDARDKLNRIADEYYLETGRDLYVTSGTRTPKSQAEAMYDNFLHHRNQNPPYKDQVAFNQIKAVYELGVHQHWAKVATIDKMTEVINQQIFHEMLSLVICLAKESTSDHGICHLMRGGRSRKQ